MTDARLPAVRVVVFTGQPDLERGPWWPVLLATPGLQAVLIYRQRPAGRRGAARRFLKNVRKHGLLWIPYRLGVGLIQALRAVRRPRVAPAPPARAPVPVEVLETDALSRADTLGRVAAWRPDLGLSLGAPILKPEVFTLPARGTINVHEGKVPDFRGAPPGFWELAAGATEIGATAHWVDAGLDTGRVVAAATAPIYAHDSLRTVQARAEELGRLVLAAALRGIASGDGAGVPQPPGGRTYRLPLLKQRLSLAARLGARRLRRKLHPRELAKTAASLLVLGAYRPVRDLLRTIRRRHPVRVFTFHRVTSLCRDGMTVAPDVFARQLEYIRRRHDIVTLEQGLLLLRSKARLARPAAVLTFDDAYRSVYEEARPAMGRLGVVGCCFVPTALIGNGHALPHDVEMPVPAARALMSWDQLRSLCAQGWAVGAHTATHARLSTLTGPELEREVREPVAALRAQLGPRALTVSYPYGLERDISPDARARIREAGYAACFSDVFGENDGAADFSDLRRIDIGGDHATLDWKRMVHGISFRRGDPE